MSTLLEIDGAPVRLAPPREPRTLRVALAGCGTVGGELVRLLYQGAEEIRARHGVRVRLVRVLVAHAGRPRPPELDPALLTTDLDAFLAENADVVVEAIGGLDPAQRIARTTLGRGRRLVTANKALIAAHGPELAELARRHRTRIDFESAVAGGIPVIRALRDSLGLTGIARIRGVLNGTTNFILTRLDEGWRYADALADAQARGFAEANPARDLSGEDAADKLRILGWLAFGIRPDGLVLRRRGIDPDAERLAADARLLGGAPRLIAEAVQTEAGVVAAVEPVIVPAASPLGRTRGEENVVVIESRANGGVALSGPGAGGSPTASSLLADLVRGAGRLPRPAAAAPLSVADTREHRWALSVARTPVTGGILERTLSRAGIVSTAALADRERLVSVTGPVGWQRMDLALRALSAERLAPVISRVEVPV